MNFNLDDPNFMEQFIKMIREIVQQELKNAKYDKTEYAKVTSTPSAGSCNIKFGNEGSDIPCKINDGLTISDGDDVYVTRFQNSNSSFMITGKK